MLKLLVRSVIFSKLVWPFCEKLAFANIRGPSTIEEDDINVPLTLYNSFLNSLFFYTDIF